MNVPKNLPSILSVLSIVFSVAGLVFSPASAAANPPAINGPGPAAAWYGIHGTFNATLQEDHLQTELTNLGQQGVDVTQPQADLASGNVTAAVQWLRGYLRTSPGALGKMNGGQSAGGNAWKGPGFAWHRPSHHVWNTGSAA